MVTLFTRATPGTPASIYIRVFVKTTLGIAFHRLDPTFINVYIEALQWLTACHCVSSAEGPRVIQDGGKYSQNKYINSR